MSALTTIFNYLYVYLRVFVAFIFGGTLRHDDFPGVYRQPFYDFLRSLGVSEINFERFVIIFESRPILILIVGIFAVGSIIGLVRRLMR